MKRLVLLLVLALMPLTLRAQANDRDLLLTRDGTVYKVEAEPDPSLLRRELKLYIQNGTESESMVVPATAGGASHSDPSLAFDEDSQTLFIFWQKTPNPMSSELLFCSYHDGAFSEASSISKAAYAYRSGLKIAATAYYFESETIARPLTRKKGLSIHAIWWERTGYGEEAHYALIGLDEGVVTSIQTKPLNEFISDKAKPAPAQWGDDASRDLFRVPGVFEGPNHDAIDVVFAKWESSRFHRVTIRPIREIRQDGVIRVPDGVWRGETDPPGRPLNPDASKISIVSSATTSNLALYSVATDKVEFLLFKEGTWTDLRTVSTSEGVSAASTIQALERLVNSD